MYIKIYKNGHQIDIQSPRCPQPKSPSAPWRFNLSQRLEGFYRKAANSFDKRGGMGYLAAFIFANKKGEGEACDLALVTVACGDALGCYV